MKQAVCLLYPTSEQRILVVSRRNNTSRWGFPGGKVDPGETPAQALVRETFEETGLVISEQDLVPVHSDVCPGGRPEGAADDYWVTTYLCTAAAPKNTDEWLASMTPEKGLTVAAMSAYDLIRKEVSPFGDYNGDALVGAYRYLGPGYPIATAFTAMFEQPAVVAAE